MEQSLKKVLIELTKKHKINKNDHFLLSNEGQTHLCKMLSSDFKVQIDTKNISDNAAIETITSSELEIDKFLERYSTIGYRNKEVLEKDETLNPRISVIFRENNPKVRVHKLSDNQAKVALNVMNHLNLEHEQKQKQKAKISVR